MVASALWAGIKIWTSAYRLHIDNLASSAFAAVHLGAQAFLKKTTALGRKSKTAFKAG